MLTLFKIKTQNSQTHDIIITIKQRENISFVACYIYILDVKINTQHKIINSKTKQNCKRKKKTWNMNEKCTPSDCV